MRGNVAPADGRIIGRAQPFAKVFPSSRGVKRAVALLAWDVLGDIALDPRADDRGRLVAETDVHRIAANLGLSKTTVRKHLATLRDYGFVFHEELREAESGRYEQVRYVIDPSGCMERSTTAPGPRRRPADGGGAAPQDGPPSAGGRVPDSGTRSLSQFTRRGDLVQETEEAVAEQTQQPQADAAGNSPRQDLVAALTAAGVASSVARALVEEQPAERIRDALTALGGKRLHNRPGGWSARSPEPGTSPRMSRRPGRLMPAHGLPYGTRPPPANGAGRSATGTRALPRGRRTCLLRSMTPSLPRQAHR